MKGWNLRTVQQYGTVIIQYVGGVLCTYVEKDCLFTNTRNEQYKMKRTKSCFLSCGALTLFRVMVCPKGASRPNSEAPQSVELLWTSDQPDAQTSTWQHITLTTDIHVPKRFEPATPASERPQTNALDRASTGIGLLWIP